MFERENFDFEGYRNSKPGPNRLKAMEFAQGERAQHLGYLEKEFPVSLRHFGPLAGGALTKQRRRVYLMQQDIQKLRMKNDVVGSKTGFMDILDSSKAITYETIRGGITPIVENMCRKIAGSYIRKIDPEWLCPKEIYFDEDDNLVYAHFRLWLPSELDHPDPVEVVVKYSNTYNSYIVCEYGSSDDFYGKYNYRNETFE